MSSSISRSSDSQHTFAYLVGLTLEVGQHLLALAELFSEGGEPFLQCLRRHVTSS
jgi:hypothetical protein